MVRFILFISTEIRQKCIDLKNDELTKWKTELEQKQREVSDKQDEVEEKLKDLEKRN